METDNYKVYRG